MKEESRIEALEHEVKILKNEIQTTLLEIREQILNHYYPELRAEEPLRSLSLPVRQPVGNPGVPKAVRNEEPANTLSEITAKGQVNPFSDISLDDLSDDDFDDNDFNKEDFAEDDYNEDDFDDDDLNNDDDIRAALDEVAATAQAESDTGYADVPEISHKVVSGSVNHGNAVPGIREVDFRKLKQTTIQTANVAATPNRDSAPAAREYVREEVAVAAMPKPNRMNMTAMAAWITDGIDRVGKERTIEIIDTYVTGGKISEANKSSLMKMISQAKDSEPDTPVGSRDMLTLMVGLDQILDQ